MIRRANGGRVQAGAGMIRRRNLWGSLAAGFLLASLLAGCAGHERAADAAPTTAEMALAEAVAEAGTAGVSGPGQCYWLSDTGEGWRERTDLPDPEYCYELDSCAGGVGLSGGGCYKWAVGPEAPGTPWSDFGFVVMTAPWPAPAAEESGAACYWRPDVPDVGWTLWGGREAKCYEKDACSGGLSTGNEGAACYKWAMGPDEPALPWNPAFTNLTPAQDIPPPEEIYEGAFEMTSDSCFENCKPQPTRLDSETVLYAQPDATSPVVGRVPPSECVGNKDYRLRSAPVRGVVIEDFEPLAAGDVIYDLAYQGEGYYTAWRRGEEITLSYEDVVVRWDDPPESPDPRVGYWLELLRADGTIGWARDAEAEFVYDDDPACAFLK